MTTDTAMGSFSMGVAPRVRTLTVHWKDGRESTFYNVLENFDQNYEMGRIVFAFENGGQIFLNLLDAAAIVLQ